MTQDLIPISGRDLGRAGMATLPAAIARAGKAAAWRFIEFFTANEGNNELYGKNLTSKEILTSDVTPPSDVQPLLAALSRYSSTPGHDAADRAKPNR
jgi:hypothetical protein